MSTQVIRFDWAIKKLLRDKARFGFPEGVPHRQAIQSLPKTTQSLSLSQRKQQ